MKREHLECLYYMLLAYTEGEEIYNGAFNPDKYEGDREVMEILNALKKEIIEKNGKVE